MVQTIIGQAIIRKWLQILCLYQQLNYATEFDLSLLILTYNYRCEWTHKQIICRPKQLKVMHFES